MKPSPFPFKEIMSTYTTFHSSEWLLVCVCENMAYSTIRTVMQRKSFQWWISGWLMHFLFHTNSSTETLTHKRDNIWLWITYTVKHTHTLAYWCYTVLVTRYWSAHRLTKHWNGHHRLPQATTDGSHGNTQWLTQQQKIVEFVVF